MKKEVFEFEVTKNRYYLSAIYGPILILCILALILTTFVTTDLIFVLLSVGLLSYPLCYLLAEKYACGKIRITVDNEGLFFEWPKQIPFENNQPIRIPFAKITDFDFLVGGTLSCPGIRFFMYPRVIFCEVTVPVFTTLMKRSSFSDFKVFLNSNLSKLKEEGI